MDHGRILLPAKLNGTDVYFLFTNATDSWIRADVAERLNMGHAPLAPETYIFVGGKDRLPERRTAALELGGVHWRDFAFLPSPAGVGTDDAVVGTIGLDAFVEAKVDLEFDLGEDLINVIARNDCRAPPWAGDAKPVTAFLGRDGIEFQVTLDGERLRAVVAPALAQTRMPAFTARRQFGLFRETEHEDPDVHGPPTMLPHRFASLQLGDTALETLDVSVVRQLAPPHWNYAPPLYPFYVEPLDFEWFAAVEPTPTFYEPSDFLMLGVADLTRLRLYFAFGRNELFVVPAPHAP